MVDDHPTGADPSLLPSLAEVARRAEVSLSTASRVMSGDPSRVTPALRKRVQAAARETDYVPNVLARNLRSNRFTTVGLIIPNMLDPYFAEIAEATTSEASALNLMALVCNSERDPAKEVTHCEWLLSYRVGGVILGWSGMDDQGYSDDLADVLKRLQQAGTAVVSLAPKGVDVPTISIDNHAAGALIAHEILASGHREAGMITGPRANFSQKERTEGFSAAMAAGGGRSTNISTEFSVDGGAAGLDQLLERSPDVEVVVGGSDTIAWGAIERLRELGLDVPRDVAVIGIGRTLISRVARPKLTTLDMRLTDAARMAVRALAEIGSTDEPWDVRVGRTPALQPSLHIGETFVPRARMAPSTDAFDRADGQQAPQARDAS